MADKYAFEHFGNSIPVPSFVPSGSLDTNHFSVTQFVPGTTSRDLDDEALARTLSSIHDTLAAIYTMDISSTNSYGAIDLTTGNAGVSSWRDYLEKEFDNLDIDSLRKKVGSLRIEMDVLEKFVDQFEKNLSFVSETRWLLHGDPGHDNFITEDGRVVAVIDWEQMAYGDWVRDFSRFAYYGIQDYGDIRQFAARYELDDAHIKQRIAVYWALNILKDIEFALRQGNEKVADWLRRNASEKLI